MGNICDGEVNGFFVFYGMSILIDQWVFISQQFQYFVISENDKSSLVISLMIEKSFDPINLQESSKIKR